MNTLIPAAVADILERCKDYDDTAGVSTRMGDLRAMAVALETAAKRLAAIFEAHDSYRETVGPDGPTDWLDDAINSARA